MEGTLENLPKFSGNVITNEVRFLVGSTIHLPEFSCLFPPFGWQGNFVGKKEF